MLDAGKLAEPADVVMCYRLFLRREPESQNVVDHHLSNSPTVWELIQRFLGSNEHEAIKIHDGALGIWQRQDGRQINIQASKSANKEILRHVQDVWTIYGKQDPYYSVLIDSAYKAENITLAKTQQFYESGFGNLAHLKLAFERNQIPMNSEWRVLELGCGVGRIAEHFCSAFAHYDGVDISATHLALASDRFAKTGITNGKLWLLDEALNNHMQFDIFYSMIVLQHNPPPVIVFLLDKFLAKLNNNGFAFSTTLPPFRI